MRLHVQVVFVLLIDKEFLFAFQVFFHPFRSMRLPVTITYFSCRLQVAEKSMPAGSLIIGVDLLPIKPIKGCLAFQEDITSQKCRNLIKKECKARNLNGIDVILHDGAPNVGGATWLKDAYGQVELVVSVMTLFSLPLSLPSLLLSPPPPSLSGALSHILSNSISPSRSLLYVVPPAFLAQAGGGVSASGWLLHHQGFSIARL